MAASQVMRITLKAYDHQLIDASAKSIIETVKKRSSQFLERLTNIKIPESSSNRELTKD